MNWKQNGTASCYSHSQQQSSLAGMQGLVAADGFVMQTDQWRSARFSWQSLLGGGVRQLPEMRTSKLLP